MAMFYLENTPHAKSRDGVHIATQNHFDYICREGKYERLNSEREDLVYKTSGNLPKWAKDAKEFWTEAERHRRFKGRAYREVKLALQEELTLEENIGLVEAFCDKMGISQNHVYTYAIHDKPAAFDHNHRNIHCHLMFDERVLEAQRPLGPEQFFSRYSEDKEGNPTGGYYKDRYYNNKASTIDMRRIWAQLVNEKFAEKGLDIRISEKSLEAQYYELKKAGKDDEAEYYNRKPVPHMGKSYRNPKKIEKINNFTRNLEKELEDYTDEENGTFYDPQEDAEKTDKQMKEATAEEQKMIIFAADALMRRIAREIQVERKKEKEQQKRIAEEEQIKEELAQPMVITVADISDVMKERALVFKKTAAEQEALFKNLQKQLLSDKVIAAKAESMVLPQGRDLKLALDAARKKKAFFDQRVTSFSVTNPKFDQFMKDYSVAIEGYNKANGAYLAFEKLKESKKDLIQAKAAELKKEQAEISKQSKEAYRAWNFNKKQLSMYEDRLSFMQNEFSEDKIIYADWLPKTLERKNRIEGKTPVYKLPLVFYGNSTYRILTDKEKLYDVNNKDPILAIREGDFVSQGKVPVHELKVKLEQATSSNGKPYVKVTAVGAKETGDVMNLYKTHNREGFSVDSRGDSAGKSLPPRVQHAVASQRNSALDSLLDKLTSANVNAASGKLISFNTDEDRKMKKRDDYIEAEEAMESWADGLKLGRFSR